jgi:FKBP-type peptidyl-prolyl cis-trans isomerase
MLPRISIYLTLAFVVNFLIQSFAFGLDVQSSDNDTAWIAEEATLEADVQAIVAPEKDVAPEGSWSGRWGHVSVSFLGKIWILGGREKGNSLNDVWVSSNGRGWKKITDSAPWPARRGHGAVVFEEKLWLMGGLGGGLRNDVWYSEDGESWHEATGAAPWPAREGHSTLVHDGRMWVIGGNTGDAEEGEIHDAWSSKDGVRWVPETADIAQRNFFMGRQFLEENATKEGIVVLESGLQYEVLREGDGRKPTADDRVRTHYAGTFIDGTPFDSSIERGQPFESFMSGGVIPGWIEALKNMKTGGKWRIFIPPELAYGEQGVGEIIPANSVLIFEMELLEILESP